MGASHLSQAIESVSEITTNALTSIIVNANTDVLTRLTSNQKLVVDLSGSKFIGCNVTITQDAELIGKSISNDDTQIANALSASISSSVAEQLNQTLQQVNDGLNNSSVNPSVLETNIKTYIANNLNTLVKTGISKIIKVNSEAIQEMHLIAKNMIVKCEGGSFDVNQANLIKAVADSIAETVVKTETNNTVINQVITISQTDLSNKKKQRP